MADFWAIYLALKRPDALHDGTTDYSLFHSEIRPVWEDPANKNGGKLLLRIKKGNIISARYWETLVMNDKTRERDTTMSTPAPSPHDTDRAVSMHRFCRLLAASFTVFDLAMKFVALFFPSDPTKTLFRFGLETRRTRARFRASGTFATLACLLVCTCPCSCILDSPCIHCSRDREALKRIFDLPRGVLLEYKPHHFTKETSATGSDSQSIPSAQQEQ